MLIFTKDLSRIQDGDMKHSFRFIALLLMTLVASCSFCMGPEGEVRSEEEIRLERACHIDSTTLLLDSVWYSLDTR